MGIVLYQWMQYEERAAVRADRRSDAAAAVPTVAPAPNGGGGGAPER
jgi:hypothetical protein